MFDIGSIELLVVALVALLVLGPERLPVALRTMGLWMGRLRRSFSSIKTEIENEIGMDEIRRQLHNEAVMDEIKRIEDEVQGKPVDTGNAHEIDEYDAEDPAPGTDPDIDTDDAQSPAEAVPATASNNVTPDVNPEAHPQPLPSDRKSP